MIWLIWICFITSTAFFLFLSWLRSSELCTANPEGIWVTLQAESVLFTCWPPAPLARMNSNFKSFSSTLKSYPNSQSVSMLKYNKNHGNFWQYNDRNCTWMQSSIPFSFWHSDHSLNQNVFNVRKTKNLATCGPLIRTSFSYKRLSHWFSSFQFCTLCQCWCLWHNVWFYILVFIIND